MTLLILRITIDSTVDDVLAVQGVVGDHAVDRFPHPQTVGIVVKGGGGRAVGHLLQLPALLPCVRPHAVGEGIANLVVGNGRAVVGEMVVHIAGVVRRGVVGYPGQQIASVLRKATWPL